MQNQAVKEIPPDNDWGTSALGSPERTLLAGILKRAVTDALTGIDLHLIQKAQTGCQKSSQRLALAEEALGWIFSDDNKQNCADLLCNNSHNPNRHGKLCRAPGLPQSCRKLTFCECCLLTEPPLDPPYLRRWVSERLAQEGLLVAPDNF
ncbi:MAG: hypothetical protein PVG03_06080 [Desulfarculaceae bacterium]|jgi:hypothetical protein